MNLQSLGKAFANQIRVIAALTMREFRIRNSRYPFSYFVEFLETCGLLVFFYLLAALRSRHPAFGDSFMLFLITGLLPLQFFRSVSTKSGSAIKSARSVKVVHLVENIDLVLAKTIIETTTNVVIIIGALFIVHVFKMSQYAVPSDMEPILLALALLLVMGVGTGLINSIISSFFPLWTIIWNTVMRASVFLSGVFYVPDHMPPAFRDFLWWNPIAHIIALFRHGFYPSYPTNFLSVTYLTTFAVSSLVAGLALERALRHRVAVA